MESSNNLQDLTDPFAPENEEMQMKYNNFYAQFEIMESEQINSDLDNLDSLLHERIGEGRYDIIGFPDDQKTLRNVHQQMSSIPIVYLVTCIRTQHLPERKSWLKDLNQQEGQFQSFLVRNQKNNHQGIQYNQNFSNSNEFNFRGECFQGNNSSISKKNYKAIKNTNKTNSHSHQYESKWKTDYIVIKRQQNGNPHKSKHPQAPKPPQQHLQNSIKISVQKNKQKFIQRRNIFNHCTMDFQPQKQNQKSLSVLSNKSISIRSYELNKFYEKMDEYKKSCFVNKMDEQKKSYFVNKKLNSNQNQHTQQYKFEGKRSPSFEPIQSCLRKCHRQSIWMLGTKTEMYSQQCENDMESVQLQKSNKMHFPSSQDSCSIKANQRQI